MVRQMGKGSKWRQDFDFEKYYTNRGSISGEKPKPEVKKVIKKGGKTTYVYK